MAKRILGLLFLLFVSLQVFAYDFSAVNNDGNRIYYNIISDSLKIVKVTYRTTSYNSYSGTISIPSSVTYNGNTYSVICIGNGAFANSTSLTNVNIPNSVTSIENSAFSQCSGLTNIILPNSVTSIGASAFYGCSNLISINIPNSVTSIGVFNDNNPFVGCSNLNTITVASGNVVYDSRSNCNAIIETSSNKLIVGCKNTTIPNSVTHIGTYAFYQCTGLTNIIIPNSVTSIGVGAFWGCSGLTSVTIPNSVTFLGSTAFSGCSNLASITIPNSIENVYDETFRGCVMLSSITSSATTAPQLGTDVFRNVPSSCDVHIPCGSLQSYSSTWTVFSNFVEDVVFSVDAFSNDTAMGSAVVTTQPTCANPSAVLTATANQGYQFVQWSDGDTNNPRTVSVTQDTTIVAQFASTSNICASGVCGANLTWTLYNDGELRISGTGAMYDYSVSQTSPWLQNTLPCQITYVVLEPGVTSIGEYAFYNCQSLTNANIPTTVTNVGENAFYNCSGLTSIAIPNSITSIEEYVFAFCSGLTSVAIPNSVTTIGGHAFERCSSLSSIIIPNSVISIGNYTFSQCSNLTSINIPNSVTSVGDQVFNECFRLRTATIGNSVRSIGYYAFHQCTDLTSIILPNSVKSVGFGAFHSCSSLSSAILSDSITKINDYTFESCPSLTSIIVPNSVTSIGNSAFLGCRGLSQVAFGNSVTNIGNNAFNSCSGLRSITIPNSVTNIGNDAFRGCYNLDTIVVASGNAVYDSRNNCNAIIETSSNYLILGCKNTTIPNSVASIGNYAFQGCSGWKSLILPKSITNIGTYAFQGCYSLKDITSLATTAPQIITNSFSLMTATVHIPCGSLQSYSSTWTGFSNFVEDVVFSVDALSNDTAMGSAVVTTQPTCANPSAVLTATANQGYQFVQWSDGDTSNPRTVSVTQDTTIVAQFAATTNICASGVCGDSLTWTLYNDGELRISGTGPMFNNYAANRLAPWLQATSACSITNVVIDSGVTSIAAFAFWECSTLTSISIPNSVTSIGKWTFKGCSNLVNIIIPNSVTNLGDYVFYDCSSLANIAIPNSVVSLGEYSFYKCTSLTNVTIGNSVTSIGIFAFYDCSALASIIIPNSVTTIGGHAFERCSSLSSIIIPNSVISIGNYTFSQCSNLTSITIPNSVTNIGEAAFLSCSGLTSITIPNSITNIANSVFGSCSGLTNITIPNSVTNIGDGAFGECFSLTNITIPNSVINIGEDAFYKCTGLTSITSLATTAPLVGANSFHLVNGNIPVHIPCGSLQSYSSTWTGFSNFVEDFAYSITTSSNDTAMGSAAVTTQPTCTDPTAVLTATANQGYQFVQWSDGSTSNPRTVSVTQDTTIVALFAATTNICASGVCGNSLTWTLYDDGELRISGTGAMYNYSVSQTSPWLQSASTCTITNVVIEPGVTSIGNNAFYNCQNLISISIPNTVTSIGQWAFHYCFGLTNINIPNSVTSVGICAFYYCSGLTNITIPNSVTSIGNGAFTYCSSLTNITLSESITSIEGGTFGACTALTDITIPNSVTNIGTSAFSGCTGLTSVTSLATTAPQLGSDAFLSVNSTIPVHIPCGSLQSYSSTWTGFSNFVEDFAYSITTSSNDTAMGSAAVTTQPTCTDPTAVLTATANQGYRFVQWSDGSTSNPRTVSVTQDTTIVALFAATTNICASGVCGNSLTWTLYDDGELRISGTGTMYDYSSSQAAPWTQNTSTCQITNVVIEPGVTSIGKNAFNRCSNITSVTIPNSVISIGECAFEKCSGLTSITLPNAITSIQFGTFSECSNLTNIIIPNSVALIDTFAFSDCRTLTSITLPSSVTDIKDGAFYGCNGITNITSLATTAPQIDGRDAFWNVNSRIPIFIPCGSLQSYSSEWTYFSNFKDGAFVLQATSADNNMGEVSVLVQPTCSNPTATIQAVENTGYHFTYWSDGSTQNPRTITLTSDTAIVANFIAVVNDTTFITASICQGDTYTWHGQVLSNPGVYQTLLGQTQYGADSIEILTLTVTPLPTKAESATICQNNLPYIWRGVSLNAAGTYAMTIPSVPCDSVITFTLTLSQNDTTRTSASICQGDSYVWHGQALTNSGIYQISLGQTQYGCDSIEILTLTVNPHPTKAESAIVCKGDLPYAWRGQMLTTGGTYVAQAPSSITCDTIVTLNLTIVTNDTVFANASICQGDTYSWRGQQLSMPGTYSYVLGSTRFGCDSIEVLNLSVNPLPSKTENIVVCENDLPYVWRGLVLNNAGTYSTTVASVPCDSVITLNLSIAKRDTTRRAASICFGDTYIWHGQNLTTSGVYQTLLGTTKYGCDSLEILTLTVNPRPTKNEQAFVCKDDMPYVWRGSTIQTAGTYSTLAPSSISCDTVVTLNLTVVSPDTTFITAAICQGDVYSWHGQSLTTAGTYTYLLGATRYGCDSIERLNLIVNPHPYKTETAVACKGDMPYSWRGMTIQTAGTYTTTAQALVGCDTIVSLTLSVASPDTTFTNTSICQGDVYAWHGQSLTTAGVYTYQLGTTRYGCDSIEMLTLTVNPHLQKQEFLTICKESLPFVWRGMTLTAAGTYTTTAHAVPCDSVITLTLNLSKNDTTRTFASICQGETYVWRGQALVNSGVYQALLGPTRYGCDSIEILTLTVNPLPTKTESAVVCKGNLPYAWRGLSLTASGTYTALAPAVNSCDTVVTLNFVVASPDTTFNAASICQGDIYSWHGQSLVSSGVYSYQLGTTQHGCDSIEILYLTVNPHPTKLETAVVCANDMPYAWRGMNIVAPGSYTMMVPSINSCDTIVTLVLSLAYNDTTYSSASICQGDTYSWHGQSLTTAGVYSVVVGLTNQGCDSVEILTLTVNPLPTKTESAVVCKGNLPYVWRGQTLTTSGVFVALAPSVNTCDTIVTLNLTVASPDTTFNIASICQGEAYIWHGQTLVASGVYTYQLGTTQYGCDSVEVLNLTVNPYPTKVETAVVCANDMPYSWRGMNIVAPGSYTMVAPSLNSCDTIVTLVLSLAYNDTTYTSASICQGDIYTWRGQTLTNAGVYSEIIGTTSMGCDSIEILTLAVNQLPTLTESAVVCQGDLPYQWRGQSLIAAGVYTANAVSASSCDTIVTLNLTVVTNDTVYTSASLCQGDSLLWHGQTLSNAGVYFETVGTTIYGCDSVEQLTVTKYSSFSVTETIEITTAELPYQWNGMSLTTAGTYVYNGQSSVGCDSIVTLILTVSTDLDFAEENLFTVSPNPVEKGGTIVIELSANTTRFEDAEINLYSPNGKLLNRFEITENVGYIKMPEVAGLYILQLVTKTGFVKYEKVVVK